MAACSTCGFEVEAARSHCRACDTPVVADATTVLPIAGAPPSAPWGAPPPPTWGAPPAPAVPSPPVAYGGPPSAGSTTPPPGFGPPAPGYGPPVPGYGPPPAWGAPAYGPVGYPVAVAPPKSKAAAAVLCFFLGAFGAHRFYTGQTGLGIALLLTTLFLTWTIIWIPVMFVWVVVDFIMILAGGVKDQYGRPLT